MMTDILAKKITRYRGRKVMGYTGPGLDFGAFQKIDDISSGFNNSSNRV